MTPTVLRPAPPSAPGDLQAVAIPDPGWRIAGEGVRCRFLVRTGPIDEIGAGGQPHGDPAAGEKLTEGPRGSKVWRGYCDEHMRHIDPYVPRESGDVHWVEDGQVMTWVILDADGKPATRRVVTSARISAGNPRGECKAHRMPRVECDPAWRHTYSMRQRGDLMTRVERAAREEGIDVNTFLTYAIEDRLGWRPSDAAPRRGKDAPAREVRSSRTGESTAAREILEDAGREGKLSGRLPVSRTAPPKREREDALQAARERAEGKGAVITTASQLPVPTGTAVFQAPGSERREEHPVPVAADKRSKKGRKGVPCEHRMQPGSFCTRCGRTVP